MTLHESKHPGYSDLGRLHQHFIGDAAPLQPEEGDQGAPTGSVMPPLPPLSSMPPLSAPITTSTAGSPPGSVPISPSASTAASTPASAPTTTSGSGMDMDMGLEAGMHLPSQSTVPGGSGSLGPTGPAASMGPATSMGSMGTMGTTGTGSFGGSPASTGSIATGSIATGNPADADTAGSGASHAEMPQARLPQRALYKHADLGRLRTDADGPTGSAEDDCFDRLARLAEPEPWSLPASGRHDDTWVLREYIEWTFERLHAQRQVVTSPDGARSAFNTGLVTAQQEPIYGLFMPNTDPDGAPWQLQCWCPDGDRRLADHFPELPAMATYAEEPAEYVFDWRAPLTVNTKNLLESKGNLAALPGALRSNPYQAGLVLEGAVKRAEARARRTHRTAVPCWDPATEQVHLLLPLALTTPDTADVALAVTREGDAYHGYTVLPLDVAYARARQIGRPDEWLRPE